MEIDLKSQFQSLSRFARKNNMSKVDLDILNIALAVECQRLVITKEFDRLPFLMEQYQDIENQIQNENGVKIA